MPVGELLSRVGSYELTEWMAFDALEREPPPPPRQTKDEVKTTLDAMVRSGTRFKKRKAP
jgi:hypothetical protein